MRVVLDARPLSHPQAGGFRTYTRALLRGLGECDNSCDLKLILYVDRELTADDRSFVPPGAQVRVLSPNRLETDFVLFRKAVQEDGPDLVQGTMNYLPSVGKARSTVTIHDAMGVARYAWNTAVPRTPRERFINRYWARMTRRSAQTARRIITDSQGAADELASVLGIPSERFTVVYPGVLFAPRENKAGVQPSILAIASPDPRKNLDLLFRALTEEVRRFPGGVSPRLDLVCSSASSARRAEQSLAKYGIRSTRLLRDVDDAALAKLYASAGVFVWPSLQEGFGLPPLEAMRCGCPVAASRAPVMPEVLGGEVPVYFDPNNPAELADTLALLLSESPEVRERRIRAGQIRAAEFTCRKMAAETVAVWQGVVESGS